MKKIASLFVSFMLMTVSAAAEQNALARFMDRAEQQRSQSVAETAAQARHVVLNMEAGTMRVRDNAPRIGSLHYVVTWAAVGGKPALVIEGETGTSDQIFFGEGCRMLVDYDADGVIDNRCGAGAQQRYKDIIAKAASATGFGREIGTETAVASN